MNIKDLMDELLSMYPNYFKSQETVDSWGKRYWSALGKMPPNQLRAGFDACMASHAYQRPPLPSEIAKHAEPFQPRAGGINRRQQWEYCDSRVPELVEVGMARLPEIFPCPGRARSLLRDHAHYYAQTEYLRDNGHITSDQFDARERAGMLRYVLTEEEIRNLAEAWKSQGKRHPFGKAPPMRWESEQGHEARGG